MSPAAAAAVLPREHLSLEVQVQSQFQLLWAVFQSHSTAEDEVIWPALKEKARSSGGKVRVYAVTRLVLTVVLDTVFNIYDGVEHAADSMALRSDQNLSLCRRTAIVNAIDRTAPGWFLLGSFLSHILRRKP